MDAPVTLRLDKETRRRIARIARRKRVSSSEIIREAIEAWVKHEEAVAPYESVRDLIGIVHGGNPNRSAKTGRQFTDLLRKRGRHSCF